MKTILLLIAALGLTLTAAIAQVPDAFNYQAIARNAQGQPVINQNISVKISIIDTTAGVGSIPYSELHLKTTNQFGLFTLSVGQPTSIITGTFAGINWGAGKKYMKVELDPAAGTNYSDMGTTQLLSVPFAFSSNDPWKKTGNDIVNTNTKNVGIGVASIPSESKLVVGAVNSINEGGQIQLNAPQPTGTNNKAYYIDVYDNQLRIVGGTNSASSGNLLTIEADKGIKLPNKATATSDVNQKLWGNSMPLAVGFVAGPTGALFSDYGIASVTRQGTGSYLVNISHPWAAGANPVVVISARDFGSSSYNFTATLGQVNVSIRNGAGTTALDTDFSIIIYPPVN